MSGASVLSPTQVALLSLLVIPILVFPTAVQESASRSQIWPLAWLGAVPDASGYCTLEDCFKL